MIASEKPAASATSERAARWRRRCTKATQKPAIGPNSGPTTIAPTIRIGELRKIPTAAIRPASTMNNRYVPDSSTCSLVRDSTSSQTTASASEPRARSTARSANSEIWVSTDSSAIEPVRWMSSSLRSDNVTLASSRATSARITSPAGSCAAPGSQITLQTDSLFRSIPSACSETSRGATIRMWTIAGAYPAGSTDPHRLRTRPAGQRCRSRGAGRKTPCRPVAGRCEQRERRRTSVGR